MKPITAITARTSVATMIGMIVVREFPVDDTTTNKLYPDQMKHVKRDKHQFANQIRI